MTPQLRKRLAMAAIALCAVSAIAACTPEPEEIDPPSFALTSAEIVFGEGRPYPINLIFLAKDDDPIWTDLTGVELPGNASVGPGQFEVIRGEGSDGYRLGNISFDLDIPDGGLSFASVGLIYDGVSEPVPTPVGSWALNEAPLEDFATAETDAEVVAMGGCTSADVPVPESVSAVDLVTSGSEAVRVEHAVLHAEDATMTVTLSCGDGADFYIISPTLHYTDDAGADRSTRLSPIAIGFQDIDGEDLKRIRQR